MDEPRFTHPVPRTAAATLAAPVDRWRVPTLELTGVVATAATHLVLTPQPQAHFVFVVAAVLGWGGYIGWAAARAPERLDRWGLRREGFAESMAVTLPLAAIVATALIAWGRLTGAGFDAWMLIPFTVYPIWGVIQQLLVQGMVVQNLDDLRVSRVVIVLLAAGAFGLVHWPYPVLMAATVGLGLVFTPIYLKFRNLWVLGLWHGWLGTLLYQFVLHRHPVHEALGLG